MDEVIVRATKSISHRLSSSSWMFTDITKSQMINTINILNRLLEPSLIENNSTQLFCRQLNRLMDYNKSLTNEFWIQLYDDVVYVINNSNDEQDKGSRWERFLERMKLESILLQRESQFQQTFGKRKSLRQIFCEDKIFFQEYLQKCIYLHSKIQVQGLIKNIDDFLHKDYGLRDVLFGSEYREHLRKQLECVEITFDCSNRLLNGFCFPSSTYDKSYTTVYNSLNNFLPSIEPLSLLHKNYNPVKIKSLLEHNRWIVILGDPGSAKTTLLRWITHIFAESAHRHDDIIDLEQNHHFPVRIPILIRISEFSLWLEQNPTKTLINYIGKHTWFSEPYCYDDSKNMLKEIIYHGHALILLDGLDEISEIKRRHDIVDLIRKFIDEYVRTSDFISPFDKIMFKRELIFDSNTKIVQVQSPSEPNGNQIVITSRIVGYQLHPLSSPFIEHYLLLLMDHEEAYQFVKKWISCVEKSIFNILKTESIQMNKNIMETSSKRRHDAVKRIFENGSKLLVSNPSLLSLICISIFQSFDEFCPKSRIEVYHYAVQAAFHSWSKQTSGISKSVLTNFLMELGTYIHLQSPSGLIDTFDMKHLCCLTLYQQNVSNDRVKLHEYANKLIDFLNIKNGIVFERGLQIFGFLHLSFQEYFVSQALVKGSSIEEITKRILTFVINPRFRESLLLALGWISWKWSFNDYDKFCNLLISPIKDYAIPFGTLLFFDAYNDLHRLPTNSVIFAALNHLMNHSSNEIRNIYFISNFFVLHETLMLEWMNLYLNDEEILFKFCLHLLMKIEQFDSINQLDFKLKLTMIYKYLRSIHNTNMSTEFVIDQTLQKLKISGIISDEIINELALYFSSQYICISKIHPLILSTIIAVSGGIILERNENIIKISFSPKHMHRESSILSQIIEYFTDKKESHSVKVNTLIIYYENFLGNCSPMDTSLVVVDTFIALICLQGFSQPLIYKKYDGYQALSLALNRFKRIWFYLKKLYENTIHFEFGTFKSSMIVEVKSIMNVFLSQFNQTDKQRMEFLVACALTWQKLGFEDSSDLFAFDIFDRNNTDSHLDASYSPRHRNLVHLLLKFVPQSLHSLYYYMIIAPINHTDSLPLVVLLSQSLIHFEKMIYVNKNSLGLHRVLLILQNLFKEHLLENYVSVLLWENEDSKDLSKAMQNRMSSDQSKDWEILINMERQRIHTAKTLVQCHQKDLQFFVASISFARLFQAQYRSRKHEQTKNGSLLVTERKEIFLAIINILDPILRIIALSMILDMKDPLIFDEEQQDKLRWEMIILLQYLLPRLSLLISTFLFIRCHTACINFPTHFQHMTRMMGEKLNKTSIIEQSQSQEASFIALRQLNNSDLSHYISEFAKRTMNLSEILQFNSTIFYSYFTNTISFDSSNTILLSSLYLTELAFDTQILKMYTNDNYKNDIPSLKQLWNNSSKEKKIMTFKVAIWITNYLEKGNQQEIHHIIVDLPDCLMIERKALMVIKKWLIYRTEKDLRFFALYAALQLSINGSNIPVLTDIIKQMLNIDINLRLKSLVEHLLSSQLANLNILREILILLNRDIRRYRYISIIVHRKEMLELILTMELNRIILNTHQSSEISTKPYLVMIKCCSKHLQFYLEDHIRTFINVKKKVQNVIKEEYVAIVIKWIVKSSIWYTEIENFSTKLYQYIFTLLYDHRFPRVQKAILDGLNFVFMHFVINNVYNFMQENAIIHLEKIISSYQLYSDDIIVVCLLAYGNYLLRLQKFKINRKIASEIQQSLSNLFEKSSSEMISIRAAFCLIFIQHLNIVCRTLSNWFEKKENLTVEKRYNILLQQTLFKVQELSFEERTEKVVDYIEIHSDKLLDIFVNEFYNYLHRKRLSHYLNEPIPNYIFIALKFSKRNFNTFHSAIQKSSFGEEKFKREIYFYFYYTANPSDHKPLAQLYAAFGVVTIELIDMLPRIEDDWIDENWNYLERIKQVSDRNVTKKLFEYLYVLMYNKEFERFLYVLNLLIQLAQVHAISLMEVHQQISNILNNISYENDDQKWYNKKEIIYLLLDLSCIQKIPLWVSEKTWFTLNDINENFERQIQKHEKNSSLLLNNFRPISNILI